MIRTQTTTVVFTDLVGSTELAVRLGHDAYEEVRRSHFEVLRSSASVHQGSEVKSTGDGLVFAFASAAEAVASMIRMQQSVSRTACRGGGEPRVRIGASCGETNRDSNDIFGRSVVEAARLCAAALPGQILISDVIPNLTRGLEFKFGPIKEFALKGLPGVSACTVEWVPRDASDDIIPPSGPSLADKPSIAVLPFVNMSGDHAHDYLSDGITENIITGLSRFRDLSVIASQSTFAYKGKALRIQDVASELRVRFVLEGSVQKSSTRVTITAQLIDGLTGAHLWAERFDRGVEDVEDIATILDDLTEIIVANLATTYGGRLGKAWRGRAERTSPQNFQAYDYFQRGVDAFNLFTKGCTATAIQWFEKAIERDPSYGKPYAKIAWAHLVDVWLGWSEDTSFSMAEALKFATAAIQHDDDEAWGYWAMAGYHMFGGHHDRAISAYQRALELNPNDADVLNDFGQCLSFAGRATEGVVVVHKAMRLNPHYPDYWTMQLGPIYFDARRYEDAISTLERLHSSKDTIGVQLYLAASHAALGHTDQARATMAGVIRLDPLATLKRLAPTFLAPYKNASDRDHLRENLVKAELPE
jgi:adenylate cyclase